LKNVKLQQITREKQVF